MKKNGRYLVFGLILIAAISFGWSALNKKEKTTRFWKETTIQCLSNGHENLALHIHQMLTITIDGVSEEIPANIGIASDCMAEVHTHDTIGKIHVEATQAGKAFTLADFFAVWEKNPVREGYKTQILFDGVGVSDGLTRELRDGQKIEIIYTKQ